MSIFDDIIKALPENSILREKVRNLASENDSLKTEVASLKDDNRQLRTENEKLKNRIVELTRAPSLDEIKIAILKTLAQEGSLYLQELESILQLPSTKLEYHVQELEEQGYVGTSRPVLTRPDVCKLEQKGREYVVKSGLI